MRETIDNSDLFTANRFRLRAELKPRSIVIIVSNDVLPTNADGVMPYHQNADLYYLTGICQEDTVLVLMPDAVDEREREILFVKETSPEIAVWEGEKLDKSAAAKQSGIKRVEWRQHFEGWLHLLVPQMDNIYLLTNEHLRAETIVETANDRFIASCRGRYPLHYYHRLAPIMHRLRAHKDPAEIALIGKACEITEAGFRRVLNFVKPGVGEWEIEAEYIHEFVRRGSSGFAYPPIIGSGKNTCVLHYVQNSCRCEKGDLLLMDVGAEWSGYKADMTRTIPVSGQFTKRQKEVYNAVLRVMLGANEILRPGHTPKEYHREVLELMEAELVNLGLLSMSDVRNQGRDKTAVKKYFMHGTSHHLGLDVHDVAPPHYPFTEGMVFTIEPGIYIPEENLGIRLENNVVIEANRNVDLMASIPLEADEIEALMTQS